MDTEGQTKSDIARFIDAPAPLRAVLDDLRNVDVWVGALSKNLVDGQENRQQMERAVFSLLASNKESTTLTKIDEEEQKIRIRRAAIQGQIIAWARTDSEIGKLVPASNASPEKGFVWGAGIRKDGGKECAVLAFVDEESQSHLWIRPLSEAGGHLDPGTIKEFAVAVNNLGEEVKDAGVIAKRDAVAMTKMEQSEPSDLFLATNTSLGAEFVHQKIVGGDGRTGLARDRGIIAQAKTLAQEWVKLAENDPLCLTRHSLAEAVARLTTKSLKDKTEGRDLSWRGNGDDRGKTARLKEITEDFARQSKIAAELNKPNSATDPDAQACRLQAKASIEIARLRMNEYVETVKEDLAPEVEHAKTAAAQEMSKIPNGPESEQYKDIKAQNCELARNAFAAFMETHKALSPIASPVGRLLAVAESDNREPAKLQEVSVAFDEIIIHLGDLLDNEQIALIVLELQDRLTEMGFDVGGEQKTSLMPAPWSLARPEKKAIEFPIRVFEADEDLDIPAFLRKQ